MRRVTASDARRNWFRLLDAVAGGEKVVIERHGKRIVLSCEDPETDGKEIPDYRKLISAPKADRADRWSWNWSEDGVELVDSSDE